MKSGRHQLTKLGFHLLVGFWVLSSYFPSGGYTIANLAQSMLLLSSVICFAIQIASGSFERKFEPISRGLLKILLIWCLLTLLRGFFTGSNQLFTLIANPDVGGLVWLLPFAAYIGRQAGVLQELSKIFIFHTSLGCLITAIAIYEIAFAGVPAHETMGNLGLLLMYPAPFLLLSGIASRKNNLICLSALILASVANYYSVNRSALAISLVTLLIIIALGTARSRSRLLLRAAIFGATSLPLVYLGIDSFIKAADGEWLTDSRTFLVLEFTSDFSEIDWIIGRGALGYYYSYYFDQIYIPGVQGDSSLRQSIEIGYLHLVLKSGLIGAILYFLVMSRAAYRAAMSPVHRLGVGVALFLVLHLIEMVAIGQASMLPGRVILWIIVGASLTNPSFVLSRMNRS